MSSIKRHSIFVRRSYHYNRKEQTNFKKYILNFSLPPGPQARGSASGGHRTGVKFDLFLIAIVFYVSLFHDGTHSGKKTPPIMRGSFLT